MRITLLILAAAFLPLLWGWGVYHAMRRFWPEKWTSLGGHGDSSRGPSAHSDYQI